MGGNLWEHTEDDYHLNYNGAPTEGEAWIDSPRADIRSVRGAAWSKDPDYTRATRRNHNPPVGSNIGGGFRLARTIMRCGDGIVDVRLGEECDDGNQITDDCAHGEGPCIVCGPSCTEEAGRIRACGDGIVDPEEACDDGNVQDGDGCDSACQVEVCLVDRFEDNNDFANPSDVDMGLYDDLQICIDDEDWFAIGVCPGATLTVETLFSHADGDIDVALHELNGSIEVRGESDTDNEVINWVNPWPWTRAVRFRVYSTDGTEPAYRIRFQEANCPANGTLRLVDGNNAHSGRVEAFFNGEWGTVCDDAFDIREAQVICNQLGYDGAIEAIPRFGAGIGQAIRPNQIWFDELACTGFEQSLASCANDGLGVHDCGHGEDAGVVCRQGGGNAVCGNGIVEGNEECDDGNGNDWDDCDNNCRGWLQIDF